MLDSFMCGHTEQEFEALCTKLGLTNKSRISYKDFLKKFEILDTTEGHKWLCSDHRFVTITLFVEIVSFN